MSKIYIFTPLPFWNIAVDELISELKKEGYEIIIVDLFVSFKIIQNDISIEYIPKYIRNIFFLRKLYARLFGYFIVKYILKKYVSINSVINIHYVLPEYERYIRILKKVSSSLILTFWGSDLYRISRRNFSNVKTIVNVCDSISIAESMKNDLFNKFSVDKSKVKFARFGSKKLDQIKKYASLENLSFREEFKIPQDRVVITCGYNGIEAQQHFVLLDKINQLDICKKSKIFVVLPMTYGLNESYLLKIKEKIDSVDFDCLIIDQKLSDEAVVKLRFVSDIVLNIQTSDALAGSIQESLMAGNVVLVGDWLPYTIYDENNIYYFKSSVPEIVPKLNYIIDNLDVIKLKCKINTSLIYNLTSWNIRISDWKKLYDKNTL